MKKLDGVVRLPAKVKAVVQKDRFDTCAYIYRDGIAVKWIDEHIYKGERFQKERVEAINAPVPIIFTNYRYDDAKFEGRIVVHNATLLLDGIHRVEIYQNNQSEAMREKGIYCDTVTLVTGSGMKVKVDLFDFLSGDMVIQRDNNPRSVAEMGE